MGIPRPTSCEPELVRPAEGERNSLAAACMHQACLPLGTVVPMLSAAASRWQQKGRLSLQGF